MATGSDRNSYDTATSSEVQGNLQTIIGNLESLLSQRDRQVNAAMANFQADGVSDEYHGKELQWKSAAHEVRTIIALVQKTLTKNDGSAHTAQTKAKGAVAEMV